MNETSPVMFTPIGVYHGNEQYKQQQPRQGTDSTASGYIELASHQNFEQALHDLDGFSHIWVLFQFHHNHNWKPKVLPPLTTDGSKKGVFATRSPHRPNPIGMSVVELSHIHNRKIYIKNVDLLDTTPILDIKPYLAHSDSFPDATSGWVPAARTTHTIIWTPKARVQAQWFMDHSDIDFQRLADVQLALDPLNTKKRRITQLSDTLWQWAFRTWRLSFFIEDSTLSIHGVSSGYSEQERNNLGHNVYGDKELHQHFNSLFGGETDYSTRVIA